MICKTVFEPCSGPHFQLACYVCKTSPVIGVIHPHAHTSIRELRLPVLPVESPNLVQLWAGAILLLGAGADVIVEERLLTEA